MNLPPAAPPNRPPPVLPVAPNAGLACCCCPKVPVEAPPNAPPVEPDQEQNRRTGYELDVDDYDDALADGPVPKKVKTYRMHCFERDC